MDCWECGILAIAAVAGCMITFMLRSLRRELNTMQVQSEAWIRIHNNQQQLIEQMQEVRADMAVMRRRTNDTMDTLFHGLEARKHLGMVSNTHDMIMELRRRRSSIAEIQHMNFLRSRLEEVLQQVNQLRDQLEGGTQRAEQLPIVRLSVPSGSELQLL